jgi:PAS domain S-box-containing protein
VNPAFEKLTGYRIDEVKGQNPKMLKSGMHDDAFYKEMWGTLNNGEVWKGELINKRKDDSLYHEEMSITPMFDVTGKATHFVAIKQDISERVKASAEREKLISDLQEALAKVNTLSGLLPICASCKKIRDDSGYWSQVEVYVQHHSNASFTHGICPECAKKFLNELNTSIEPAFRSHPGSKTAQS